MTRRYLPRESGFTLIEILVVISVIGILVSILAVAVQGVRLRALDEKTVALLRRLETGCQTYVSRYNAVPPAAPGGAPADPGNRYITSAGTNYVNSRALHYWLGSQLQIASAFNSAGVAQIVKTVEPILEFKKSEASTWDQILPASFASQRFNAGGFVSPNGTLAQGGFVLDAWGHAIAYVQANPVTAGDMSTTTFPRPGAAFGKAGRNLVGFVQMWSRGSDGASSLPGAGMAPNTPAGNGDVDDICLWFLPYY